jgi:hypothetical protein
MNRLQFLELKEKYADKNPLILIANMIDRNPDMIFAFYEDAEVLSKIKLYNHKDSYFTCNNLNIAIPEAYFYKSNFETMVRKIISLNYTVMFIDYDNQENIHEI